MGLPKVVDKLSIELAVPGVRYLAAHMVENVMKVCTRKCVALCASRDDTIGREVRHLVCLACSYETWPHVHGYAHGEHVNWVLEVLSKLDKFDNTYMPMLRPI